MQVDAKHVERHLDAIKPDGVVNEAIEQVAYADRIVLNKTDLVRARWPCPTQAVDCHSSGLASAAGGLGAPCPLGPRRPRCP